MENYRTVAREATAEQVIEKSRFIGYVRPVESREEAEAFIRSVGKLERAGYIPERTAGTAQINEEEEP